MINDRVSLSIGGKKYYGGLSVSVDMALQTLSRSFALSLTSQSARQAANALDIKIGDEAKLNIGGDLVLNGYITKVEESYSGDSHQISVAGYSKTIDLVHCSIPDGEPLSYQKQTPAQIVRSIASHYGIEVVEEVLKTDQIDFDISPEEKIKEALEKLFRKHSILAHDNELGQLVISSIGSGGICRDQLRLGVNVLTAKRTRNEENLFSRYVILGQGANPLSERPAADNHLKAVSVDANVRRRVKVITQSGNADLAYMQSRAEVVKEQSIADSETLTYTVRGWRQTDGSLWPLNSFLLVKDETLKISEEYLVSKVTFSLDAKGMTTTLGLKKSEGFLMLPTPSVQAAVKKLSLTEAGKVGSEKWTSH